jgi:hypothetical protein
MTRAGVLLFVATLAGACAPSGPRRIEIPANTEDFLIRVSWEPSPARARERTVYRIVVRDKETREFVDGGEGLVFATSADRVNIHGVMQPGEQAGTYMASLRFINSGDWAVSLQFRRDSTRALQRPSADWRQTIYAERDL